MALSGTMARRSTDSENWGGPRPNSGRKPVWIAPAGTPTSMVRLPDPLKDVLLEVRDSGASMEVIIEKLRELLR